MHRKIKRCTIKWNKHQDNASLNNALSIKSSPNLIKVHYGPLSIKNELKDGLSIKKKMSHTK